MVSAQKTQNMIPPPPKKKKKPMANSGVFIANFDISHPILLFLLLTLNM